MHKKRSANSCFELRLEQVFPDLLGFIEQWMCREKAVVN